MSYNKTYTFTKSFTNILKMPIYYFYPIIIVLALITSFTDIKIHRIMNKHLLLAIITALLVYAYLFATGKLKPGFLLLLNPLFALTIGFILYWTKTWGAGDAKLFATYSILLPVTSYSRFFLLPCLSMFLNIFLISTVFILLLTFKQTFDHRKTILKDIFSLKTIGLFSKSLAIMFSITWIAWPLIHSVNFPIPEFLMVIILFLLYKIIFKLVNGIKSSLLLFVSVCVTGALLRYIFQPDYFKIAAIFQYTKSLLFFTIIFYTLEAVLRSFKDEQKSKVAFAPFMGLGALTSNMHIIAIAINIITSLMR